MTDTPWEPPLAGTEVEHLLRARTGASALTLGGLLKHLAAVEEFHVTVTLSGEPMGSPWDALEPSGDDWEFRSAADDSPDDLYALYGGRVGEDPQPGWRPS